MTRSRRFLGSKKVFKFLSKKQIDPGQAKILAALTSMNCLNNPLGEGVHTIIKVFEETPRLRTLCGLEEGVEHIDWSKSDKGPVDVALLAAELKARRAAAAVEAIAIGANPIGSEGGAILLETIKSSKLKTIDISKPLPLQEPYKKQSRSTKCVRLLIHTRSVLCV